MYDVHDDETWNPTYTRPSKSQKRREDLERHRVARALAGLSKGQLAHVPLDDDLRDAVNEGREQHARVAKKRALDYLTKALRTTSEDEMAAIVQALDRLAGNQATVTERQLRLEQWRTHLTQNGDGAIQGLLEHDGSLDRGQVRQLVRNAAKAKDDAKGKKARRALHQLLDAVDTRSTLPEL